VKGALSAFQTARIDRTREVVARSTAAGERYHDPRLATADGADACMQEQWSSAARSAQFEWLYSYDVKNIEA
ncbi:MAG: hypothetical protein ACK5JO_18775, partial [Halodesulfovibrio sp.]